MFAVVERDGGRVVAAEVTGTAGLEHRLWLIARDRRLSIAPQPSRSCPTCGAPLIANFRWCQSCGADFEPWRAGPAASARPAPAAHHAGTHAAMATLSGGTATMTRPEPATATPPAGSTAAGVAVFVLDPVTAATASMAAPPRSTGTGSAPTIGIASNRPASPPRIVVPPPARRRLRLRLRERVADAFDGSPLDGRMILFGVLVGVSIGILVTLVLLAVE